jgi:hypothetical protein
MKQLDSTAVRIGMTAYPGAIPDEQKIYEVNWAEAQMTRKSAAMQRTSATS